MSSTIFGCDFGIEGDVVFLGIPFDHGSTSYPGCHNAAKALRILTSGFNLSQGYIWDKLNRRKILEGFSVSDMGDIPYNADIGKLDFLANVQEFQEAICKNGKIPFAIGGDHLVSLPLISGCAKATKEKFQVIQIDAHTDYEKRETGQLPTHATFMGDVHDLENVEKIIQLGVRGFAPEEEPLGHKIVHSTISQLEEDLIDNIPIYLTIDTDGFDPMIMGAVGFPEPNGLSLEDLNTLLSTLSAKNCKLIGIDWTEYNPEYEQKNQITGYHITKGIVSILDHIHNKNKALL